MANKPLIEFKSVSKHFGKCVANADISFQVQAGTVHAFVGENGAGKSTAMKLLFGLYPVSSGEIFLNGEKKEWSSCQEAIANGIGMVHQHFMLSPAHTVLDNILLGEERSWALGKINRKKIATELNAIIQKFGWQMNLEEYVENLSVGEQQRVEILKLLYRKSRILILDEPTAVLTPPEVEALLAMIKELKAQGCTILLITHKLKEVMAVADKITVFRAGKVVAERTKQNTSATELAELMVGQKLPDSKVAPCEKVGDTQLRVENCLDGINFAICAGEILGIAGVEGNGQADLIQAILNPHSAKGAHIEIFGHDVSDWDASQVRALGVGVFAEDRHRQSIMLEKPLWQNFLLGHELKSAWLKGGVLRRRAVIHSTAKALDDFDVRPRDPYARIGSLSGGNQQKLVVARELYGAPRLIIAAQPTRGVDVHAVHFIHEQLLRARDNGAAILLISSELEEVMKLSDRVIVLYNRKSQIELERGRATEDVLARHMLGGHV
jgi:general nucleoside transport system ATP-binding protein